MKSYITGLLQENYALFTEIYSFNNDILKNVHPDFMEDLPVETLRRLLDFPKSRRQVIIFLRKKLHLDEGWYDFREQRYGLCLLSADEIQKIICYIGGICFSEQIRKTILGRELVQIRRTLGDDAYTFSLRTAPLLVKPSVTAQFQVEGNSLVERMLNTGRSLIELSLAGIPESLWNRFRFKFPKNFGWKFREQVDDPEYYFNFIKKVIKRALVDQHSVAVSMIKA